MNAIQQACMGRRISRLCHFTQSRNMAHIFDEPYGLQSVRTLKAHDLPHNPTDPERYDRRDDLICCTVEYPNTYYFSTVREKERLFQDWVVLYINPAYIWHPDSQFCPCNAAKEHGRYTQGGIRGFEALFAEASPGFSFPRKPSHLISAPTDIQAEVLVPDPIPKMAITGIAVKTSEQAQREIFRLDLQGIELNIPFYIVPDFYDRAGLSRLIQNGLKPRETLYMSGERS